MKLGWVEKCLDEKVNATMTKEEKTLCDSGSDLSLWDPFWDSYAPETCFGCLMVSEITIWKSYQWYAIEATAQIVLSIHRNKKSYYMIILLLAFDPRPRLAAHLLAQMWPVCVSVQV